jgi:hypothetical protein
MRKGVLHTPNPPARGMSRHGTENRRKPPAADTAVFAVSEGLARRETLFGTGTERLTPVFCPMATHAPAKGDGVLHTPDDFTRGELIIVGESGPDW